MTTNNITDNIKVSYGIAMFDIPSKYVTIGTYANSIIISFFIVDYFS